MTNVRFAVSVHVLALLAVTEGPCTSEFIAGSVSTNPVVIRRLLGTLQRAGLVIGRTGPRGGFLLARPARDIRLDQLHRLIAEGNVSTASHSPNFRCPVGRVVTDVVDRIGTRAEKAFLEALARETLADVVRDVRGRMESCKPK
ncbi:MAG: Rrf2 family transcriptional regulator [Candidatus Eisenbacteria bacterium]|nr:Rrf2 family transcriptional regulator [Candidatus Eisenbacteria bacterium]